jgi:hypothetical protein
MRRGLLLLCVALAASAGGPAHAGPKNRQVARLSSGIAASVSGGVVASGFLFAKQGDAFNAPVLYTGIGLLLVTPSAGEFYAGQYLTIGMAVRAAAAGFAIWVLNKYTQPAKCPTATAADPPECTIFTEGAYPLMGVASIAFIGGVWYDVLDAADAADRYNTKHGFSATPAPTVMRGPHGLAPGIALTGSF